LFTSYSTILLGKLTSIFSQSKNSPQYYGTRRFFTELTSARHLSLSSAKSMQSATPPNFLKIYLNIILLSGFDGLVVSILSSGTHDRGFKPGRSRSDFFGRKNTQHAFLRRGSKAVRPVSLICGTKNNPVRLRGSRISQAKLFALEVPSFANRGFQPLHSSSMGALWS
jgi:hypothetical protein